MGAVLMDAQTARADFERRFTDVGYGHASAMLVDDLLTMIEELQTRVASLESALEEQNRSRSSEYRRLVKLECQVFGYVQS